MPPVEILALSDVAFLNRNSLNGYNLCHNTLNKSILAFTKIILSSVSVRHFQSFSITPQHLNREPSEAFL